MLVATVVLAAFAGINLASAAPVEAAPSPEPTTISLIHYLANPGPSDQQSFASWLEDLDLKRLLKYKSLINPEAKSLLNAKLSLRKRADAPLTEWGRDTLYTVPVSFGTPDQTLELIIDTGSGLLWTAAAGADGFHGGAGFQSSNSSTFKAGDKNFTMSYLDGSGAVGKYGTDKVTIGGTLSDNVEFGLADSVHGNLDMKGTTVSGLIGFSFERASPDHTTPWWLAAGVSEFSLYLGRATASQTLNAFNAFKNGGDLPSDAKYGGSLTINGVDKTLIRGEVNYVPLINPQSRGHWVVPLDSFTVGGKTVSAGSLPGAVMDSGTTMIYGPTDVVKDIFANVPGAIPSPGQGGRLAYLFPCDSDPQIAFNFGGQSYNVSAWDLWDGDVYTRGGVSYCEAGFFGDSTTYGGAGFLVGDVFLKNVLSSYRLEPPAVGFATLACNPAPSIADVISQLS